MIIFVDRTMGSMLSVPYRKFEGGNGKLSVVINSEGRDASSDMESQSHVNNHTPTTTTTALVTLSRRTSQTLVICLISSLVRL